MKPQIFLSTINGTAFIFGKKREPKALFLHTHTFPGLMGNIFQAEKPCFAVTALFFGTFFQLLHRHWRGHHHLVAGIPVCRRRNAFLVRCLHRNQNTLNLIQISPVRHRIHDRCADFSLRIDKENRANGFGIAGVRLNHAVLFGNFHTQIRNNRKRYLKVLMSLKLDIIFNFLQPGQMRTD